MIRDGTALIVVVRRAQAQRGLTRLGGHRELCSSRRTLRWPRQSNATTGSLTLSSMRRALRARCCSEAVTIATAQQAHRRGARRRSCYDRGHNACAVKTAEIAGRADAPRSDSQASSTVKLERVALSVALVVSARISALTHASTKEVLPDGERNRVCARRR